MRILHVVASIQASSGGPAVSVTRLATEQAKLGHEVVLAHLDEAQLGSAIPAPGVRCLPVASDFFSKQGRGWSSAFRNVVAAEARRVDVIHNHGLWMWPNAYAGRAARLAGKPLVISPRGMLDTWCLRRSRFKKAVAWSLFERKNLRSADLFHATSQVEVENLRAMDLKQPVVMAPNGVDLPDLKERPDRSVVETDHPLLRAKRWVVFLSRLHPKKGLDVLLDAWQQQTDETLKGTVLAIAGPDHTGYRREVENRIEELGLGRSVILTGELLGRMKDSLLANASVFVLPSYSENFGIAIAEALAWGRPVIASQATPWQEVRETGSGWWVAPEVGELSSALREALSLPAETLDSMGAAGRELVGSRYGWGTAAATITDACSVLTEGK
jgi:glycosyltransferase involved in cell wall biosynthesis